MSEGSSFGVCVAHGLNISARPPPINPFWPYRSTLGCNSRGCGAEMLYSGVRRMSNGGPKAGAGRSERGGNTRYSSSQGLGHPATKLPVRVRLVSKSMAPGRNYLG